MENINSDAVAIYTSRNYEMSFYRQGGIMSIKEWPEYQRPREKLLLQGPSALTDSELLAIFLRTGVKGYSAVDLAGKLQSDFGSIGSLLNANYDHFCSGAGLGAAKYAQLKAVLELARRHCVEQLKVGVQIEGSQMLRDLLLMELRHEPREHFKVLFLDSQHRLIENKIMFSGTLNQASVYPREIIREALFCHAAAIVLAHNHPSGIAEPSLADKDITIVIAQAANLLDIRVLDHLIVGNGEVFSFAESGLL